jgi:hypothetical protein
MTYLKVLMTENAEFCWWAMTTLAPKTPRMIWILSAIRALGLVNTLIQNAKRAHHDARANRKSLSRALSTLIFQRKQVCNCHFIRAVQGTDNYPNTSPEIAN